MTHRSGNTEQLQKIYIRGSQVRFMILPDMLKNAPMFRTRINRRRASEVWAEADKDSVWAVVEVEVDHRVEADLEGELVAAEPGIIIQVIITVCIEEVEIIEFEMRIKTLGSQS